MKTNLQICLRRAGGLRFVASEFVKIFIVALLSAFAQTTAYGAGIDPSTKPHHPSGAQETVTINLRDYGAVGDGVTDDGPALQSALDALASAGGGNLFVPDGRYAIATSVVVDFSGRAASAIIQGTPSFVPDGGADDYGRGLNLTAEFLIKTGENANAISLKNLSTLSIEDLVFIGDPEARNDAKVVLHLFNIADATIRSCEFYGLSSLVADGAIVYAQGSDLKISDSAFLGCAGNSGTYTSIVQVYDWKGISVTGTRFVDYGTRPNFYSKTPLMSPFSWVSVGGAAALTNLSPRRDVIIKDVLFDEGAYYALSVHPEFFPVSDGGAISLVFISKLYVNVTNLGEVGLSINHADNVFIENSHFGWSQNTRGAMQLAYVKNALLDQLECVASANTIIADDTVEELSVINSVYETLDSKAPVTRVITTADPEVGPVQFVNQKYLDILGHAPDTAASVYWSQQRAACHDDTQCTTAAELLNYLNGNPAATFSISGRLVDTDGLPIASATVSLSGSHVIDTLTDADGKYSFAALTTSGRYTVTPSLSFYTFNNGESGGMSQPFVTPRGDQTADFTGRLATYSIQGRVNDSNMQSVEGVTITLTGGPAGFHSQSQTTSAAGDYSFADLKAGYAYTLTASMNFYTFAPPTQVCSLAGNAVNLDFVGTARTHSIGGRVTDGTQPLSDVIVTLSGDASQITSTDANGEYLLNGLIAGGDYIVTASDQHHTFGSTTVNNLLRDQTINFAGSVIRYTISGSVTVGANGLGNVTVTLAGDQTATVVTTSTGNYSFSVDAGGNYTLTATKAGYDFAPPSVVFNNLDQNVYPSFIATPLPILLTAENTNRAIAFNSITMLREPFSLSTPVNFGADQRTRLILFALLGSQTPATITAQAEDPQGHVYPLTVEYTGLLSQVPGVSQINVRLPEDLSRGVEVLVSVTVNGLTSAPALIRIN